MSEVDIKEEIETVIEYENCEEPVEFQIDDLVEEKPFITTTEELDQAIVTDVQIHQDEEQQEEIISTAVLEYEEPQLQIQEPQLHEKENETADDANVEIVEFKIEEDDDIREEFDNDNSEPVCSKCKSSNSFFWTLGDNGVECHECQTAEFSKDPDQSGSQLKSISQEINVSATVSQRLPTRKSTRSTRSSRSKQNPYAYPRPVVPKGKGRRSIFKKTCYKAPTAVATTVTKEYVFFKGTYIQIGDIVSVRDVDGGTYYAQIRGLLQDQYCEKSAVLTWLLPTRLSPDPNKGFDPSTYTLGMEEDVPRKLDAMEFIMHAPSDYFKIPNSPYPVAQREATSGYIWTRLRPTIR